MRISELTVITRCRRHFDAARRAAVRDGIPEDLVATRLRPLEMIFAANPAIAQKLESAGLLASACKRVALGAKFDSTELDHRLAQEPSYQRRVDTKLCLINLGLIA